MENALIFIEFAVVLACIYFGAKMGGIGLGVFGGIGVFILTFIFNLAPGTDIDPFNYIPVDVMLIIAAVIAAAATMQASGGMDYLVHVAEKMLRKNPKRITFLAPLVTYSFTFLAGTGHVAYALLPVIADVSKEAGVRPERPMSIAVIASQQAITASPVSAATAAMLTIFTDVTLGQILIICVPATLAGVMIAAFVSSKTGKELNEDPAYLERLEKGLIPIREERKEYVPQKGAKLSVGLFIAGVVTIVTLGSFEQLRPVSEIMVDGAPVAVTMNMAQIIMIVMLSVSALMLVLCKTDVNKVSESEVFKSGSVAITAIFGVAWMGKIFFEANKTVIVDALGGIVTEHPGMFAVALFICSILTFSQSAATKLMMPVGVSLGLPTGMLIGMFPAVNGYFFFPNYPTVVAAINFDTTGTTRGDKMLSHSFMVPGMISTIVAVVVGVAIGMAIL